MPFEKVTEVFAMLVDIRAGKVNSTVVVSVPADFEEVSVNGP